MSMLLGEGCRVVVHLLLRTSYPWIMAYDLAPMTTLAQKEHWLTRAAEERWRLVFAHDPVVASARAIPVSGGVGCGLADLVTDEDRELPHRDDWTRTGIEHER